MNKFVKTLLNDSFGFGIEENLRKKVKRLEAENKRLREEVIKLERSLWYKEKGNR